MRLLEFEAKELLARHGIPVPPSFIAIDSQPKFLPAVVKSQVPVGGRGKGGGIAIVKTDAEYKKAISRVRKVKIKGFSSNTLLAEKLLDIDHEYYVSILVSKATGDIQLMAHTCGGVEVEKNAKSDFLRLTLTNENTNTAGEKLAKYFKLPNKISSLQELITRLYDCFIKNDALLIEVNPLVLTKTGELVAGDCKMKLDDAARFRHKDWQYAAGTTDANFVTLNQNGTVATVANGAGLAMATVDAVANASLHPANFLDIGGGANEASILAAFERIMEYPNIKVIVINIFAGITRCDEVARAIIAAKSHISKLPPLSIRLAGTNFEAAAELLSKESIPTLATLEDCIANAKEQLA